MLIRIFIILVMVASGYLMLARSAEWRPWWSQQMARLGFGSETANDNQLAQMHQELAAIKQQFADLKLALQSEVEAQIALEETELQDQQELQQDLQQEQEPQVQVAIPREELMKMAERMELRAMQYGE